MMLALWEVKKGGHEEEHRGSRPTDSQYREVRTRNINRVRM